MSEVLGGSPQGLRKIPLIKIPVCRLDYGNDFALVSLLINHNGWIPSHQFNVLQELLKKSLTLEIGESSPENLGAVALRPSLCWCLASPLLCR